MNVTILKLSSKSTKLFVRSNNKINDVWTYQKFHKLKHVVHNAMFYKENF